jgi:DNA-binding GntR family transcriptional regulator
MEAASQRATLKTQTYADLRHLLMAGKFVPGDQLTVRLLSEQLNSTIMPVREAVQRLVAEGALINLPSGRVRVPKLTRNEFHELMEIRKLLEPAACSRAAERATTAVIESIRSEERKLSEMMRNEVSDGVRIANLNFHFTIYEAAGSLHMTRLIESVWLRTGPIIFFPTDNDVEKTKYFDHELIWHKKLVRYLWERNARGAAKAMSEILNGTERFYTEVFPFEERG